MQSSLGVRTASVVVGREVELQHLRQALEAAARGESSHTVLVGDGGVGKSRLLSETVAHARQRGLDVLAGRARVTTRAPFGVIAEALRSWLRAHPATLTNSPFDHGLRLVLPEWDAPAGEPNDLSGAQLRLLALEGVVVLLRQIARAGRGALLTLDDLHLADPDSMEVLQYVSAAGIDGLAIVAALRPHESEVGDEYVRASRGDSGATVVRLEPLPAERISELVANLLDAAAPTNFVEAVVARTDGVPLLVEEVVDAYVRTGSLVTDGGAAHWRGGPAVVPRSIRAMVQSRLDNLPAEMQNVLIAGAVLGTFEPAALLGAVAVADEQTVTRSIQRGVDVGLLQARSGAIAFRHDLLGEAVVDCALPHVVKAMHRRAASALAPGLQDARRGAHLAAAGEPDAAAEALTSAARADLQRHALLSAERLARGAVEVASAAETSAQASDALAAVLSAQGRWAEALALDQSTAAELGATAERRQRMALSALEAGNADLARKALGETAPEAAPADRVLAARIALVSGHASDALQQVESVLAQELDIDARLSALDMKARTLDFLGDRSAAQRIWTLQAAEAAAHGRTQSQLRAIFQLGKLDFFDGQRPVRLREALELARTAGALVELAWAEETLAIALVLQGNPAAALEVLDVAIPRARELRLDQLAFLVTARAGALSFMQDDVETVFAEAEAISAAPEVRMAHPAIRAGMAIHSGRFEAALALLEQADALASTMPGVAPMDSRCVLPWVYVALGRMEDARSALAGAERLPDLARWYQRPVLVQAARALMDDDVAGVDAAIAAARGPMPFNVAMMRIIGARHVGGETGIRWIREALELYEAAGATVYRDRARQLLRDAGGPVPRRRAAPTLVPHSLAVKGVTARESDVLRLLGSGLSNADIAAQLYVSVRTVETHVSSLLGKLDARSRGQLIALCAGVRWSVD